MKPELPLVRCKRCGVGGRPLSQGVCHPCWREFDDMLRPSYEVMRRAQEIVRERWWAAGPAVIRSAPQHSAADDSKCQQMSAKLIHNPTQDSG